jgi:hypothetical protein
VIIESYQSALKVKKGQKEKMIEDNSPERIANAY